MLKSVFKLQQGSRLGAQFFGVRSMTTVPGSTGRLINLNDLQPLPHKQRRRVGRGAGSGRGKLSGYGHQKSRSTPRAFEGGQSPLWKRLPKIGFHNSGEMEFQVVNVDRIQQFIDMGRLKVEKNEMITIRNLIESGVINRAKEGVKLLARGATELNHPVHLEVSNASKSAIEAVEKAGGTVTCVHFNRLALRALLKPIKFDLLPRRARPPPKLMDLYLDGEKRGFLSPEVQRRNLELFGYVTSEQPAQEEHGNFMKLKRKLLGLGGQSMEDIETENLDDNEVEKEKV